MALNSKTLILSICEKIDILESHSARLKTKGSDWVHSSMVALDWIVWALGNSLLNFPKYILRSNAFAKKISH